MTTKFDLNQRTNINTYPLSKEIFQKAELSLLQYVYSQTTVAIFTSLFCATIIYIGLNDSHHSKQLLSWAIFFLAVSLLRLIFSIAYQYDQAYQTRIRFWRYVYIIGSLLGGISWGLTGIILLPIIAPAQQILLILMLAGVTAGAVQLSAAVPLAAILFLIATVGPFIVTIMTMQVDILHLFDITLSLYLIFSIFLVTRAYRLINNSIILTLENDVLMGNLETVNVMLKQAATHDPLTKVANRLLFSTMLNNLIKNSQKNNTEFALLFFDLDHFKIVNDDYGHEAGDHVLSTLVIRLRDYFRKDDRIARLGGDEFAVLIENVIDREDLANIAGKICNLVSKPIRWKEVELNVNASLGIAIYPDDGNNEEDLLRCADKCMYSVKVKGGNNFQFSNEEKIDTPA